jgi:hypothetical protein
VGRVVAGDRGDRGLVASTEFREKASNRKEREEKPQKDAKKQLRVASTQKNLPAR